MAKLEFVAGIVDALQIMKQTIAETPQIAAEEFLAATLTVTPTPPKDTGALRNSAAAYIGGKLAVTALDLVVSGKIPADTLEPRTLMTVNGPIAANRNPISDAAPAIRRSITGKSLRGGTQYTNRQITAGSLYGKISIVYRTPYAAQMHEWQGKMHEPGSGPNFISAKSYMFMGKTKFRIKKNFETRLLSRRRR